MRASELLDMIDDCNGPCTRICISCPIGDSLRDIRDVVLALLAENKALSDELNRLSEQNK